MTRRRGEAVIQEDKERRREENKEEKTDFKEEG